MRINCFVIIYLAGIYNKTRRNFKPHKGQAYIICPNHQSYIDILMTYIVFPEYFHFLGKIELRRIPLFNIFFMRMNIGVDRASKTASHKAYLRACNDIDKGISIAIFPEGTIPDSTPQLGKFKNGAFKLAIEKQVPIVPVTFKTNWKLLPDVCHKVYGGQPGPSITILHKPINTTGLTENDLDKLKIVYREVISSAL